MHIKPMDKILKLIFETPDSIERETKGEYGRPDKTVEELKKKIERMGYEVEESDVEEGADSMVDGARTYNHNLECRRLKSNKDKNLQQLQTYAFIGVGVSILFTLIIFSHFSMSTFFLTLICWIITIILFKLANKVDTISINVAGEVYPGTKSRKFKNVGVTRMAQIVYSFSELTFTIEGKPIVDEKRIKEDVLKILDICRKL